MANLQCCVFLDVWQLLFLEVKVFLVRMFVLRERWSDIWLRVRVLVGTVSSWNSSNQWYLVEILARK